MNRFSKYILLFALFLSVFSVMVGAVNAKPEQRPDIIKIGALGPLEITPGQDMEKGATLAVEEINAGDGVTVGGTTYDFDLIVETTFNPTLGIPDPATGAISLAKLLDSDDVAAVIGGFRTEVVMQLQTSLDRPMLGVGSTAPLINPYFWRLGPSNGSELSRSIIDLYGFGLSGAPYGVRNVTIVREDAAWSIAMSQGIKYYLSYYLPQVAMMTPQINFTNDIVIAPTALLDSVTTSLTPINAELDGLNVNAIMQIFSGPVGRRVTQAWHALDLPQILAGINVESQSSTFFDETDGASYGEIELETAPPDISQTNKSDVFRAAYLAKYGVQPTYTAFASYDAIYVLKDAMERADSFAAVDVQGALATTHYTGTAYEIKFTSEDNVWDHPLFGYPYGQVGYYDNGTRFVIVPGTEDLIVHDLYTTSTVGVRGQPYIQGYFAQWQYGGVKKTVWGKGPGVADDIGGLSGNMTWPIDHSDTGYVEETTEATTTDGVTSDDTTEPDDTTTTTVTEIPGFGVSMAILVLISVVFVSFKRRKNKR